MKDFESIKEYSDKLLGIANKAKRDKLDKKANPGIFVGYSSVSKAYKVYHPQTEKMTISRDVHFNEDEQWDWNNLQKKDTTSKEPKGVTKKKLADPWQDELEDDPPIRGTRSLLDIYAECNVAVCEPGGPEEALQDSN
ncbi:hypothetical protein GH714_011828 [Hevea brasiliensis]|uniref:Retroviral polymerase SH3-like domain-containing protein n=1 Tax=Hevea brasiliensis TaxID=3981 RepID=A0A6A6NAJ5_HEVBR|nr:hypothetical protein GH714_011828 [Hevea brasiliensis]